VQSLYDHSLMEPHQVSQSTHKKFQFFRVFVRSALKLSYHSHTEAERSRRMGLALEISLEIGDEEYQDQLLRTYNVLCLFVSDGLFVSLSIYY
jgi:hypothetical protein